MKKLLKNKILVFFLAIVIAFAPQTIGMERETDTRAIVVAIGVDKADGEYELSSQIIIPKFDVEFNENIHVLSAKGKTILEAYEKWIIHIGKEMGLSHTGAVVISDSVAETEDINKLLDVFIRGDNTYSNSVIISTKGSAKDLLTYSAQKDNNLSLSLENIIKQNANYLSAVNKTMQEFYIDYYKGARTSVIAVVEVVEEDYLGLSVQEEEGTPASEDSTDTNVISNDGRSAVFKNGKKIKNLTPEETRASGWMSPEVKKANIEVCGVTDERYTDADISLEMFRKKINSKFWFKNGVPRVDKKISVHVKLQSVRQEENSLDLFTVTETNITAGLREAIADKVRTEIADIVNISKAENLDILGVYDGFYRFKNKEWKEYLNSLENKDEYMENVEFFVDVQVAISC